MTGDTIKYLDRVVKFCNRESPDVIIFSGGYTNRKTAPDLSEAEMMHRYVIKRLPLCCLPFYRHVLLEKGSYTTPESVINVAAVIRQCNLLPAENVKFTVFCNTSRSIAVDLLYRRFIGRRPDIEAIDWEMESPELQIVGLLYAWLVSKIPLLVRIHRFFRIRRSMRL